MNAHPQAIDTHGMRMQGGKHHGELFTRMPISYLRWMINAGHRDASIAAAELERRGTTLTREVEVSGHALDRASLRCRRIWHETALNADEGLNSWLIRMATEAIAQATERGEEKPGRVDYRGLKIILEWGEYYPTVKTVMPA